MKFPRMPPYLEEEIPMKRSTAIMTISVTALGLALGACTPKAGPSTFSQGEAGQVQQVQFGEITALRPVEIRPGQTRIGTIAGGALGAIAGSQIGNSTASNIAGGVGGAVAGGAVGSAVQGSSRTNGMEITIRLDTGETVAIVQPGDPRDFRVGDRVRVTGSAENARVTR
jgi:outer membrane lipoprotein SlyB